MSLTDRTAPGLDRSSSTNGLRNDAIANSAAPKRASPANIQNVVGRIRHLNNTDRFLFVRFYHWFPSGRGAIAIVRPETIIRWHRAGFRTYWRWRSRNHVGRPKVSAELRTLIGEMSRANPLWGVVSRRRASVMLCER